MHTNSKECGLGMEAAANTVLVFCLNEVDVARVFDETHSTAIAVLAGCTLQKAVVNTKAIWTLLQTEKTSGNSRQTFCGLQSERQML